MKRFRHERGQVIFLTVALMLLLLGMAAITIDVGSWFHTRTDAQNAADSAARAGAELLPFDQGDAVAAAKSHLGSYAASSPDPVVATAPNGRTNSMMIVTASTVAPVYFAKLFGVDSITVHTPDLASPNAVRAVFDTPTAISDSTPIGFGSTEACADPSCFGVDRWYKYTDKGVDEKKDNPVFTLFDFTNTGNKKDPGISTIRDWIENGYGDFVGAGPGYGYSCEGVFGPGGCGGYATVAKDVAGDLAPWILDMKGKTIFVPIWSGTKANKKQIPCVDKKGKEKLCAGFGIAGFSLFEITDCKAKKNKKDGTQTDVACDSPADELDRLQGHFIQFDPQKSIVQQPPAPYQATSNAAQPFYGVKIVELTK